MKRLVGNPNPVQLEMDITFGYDPMLACVALSNTNDPERLRQIDMICESFAKRGYLVDRMDAMWAWEEISAEVGAHWLGITEPNDNIVDRLLPLFVENETS